MEIISLPEPIVMEISSFTNIADKLNFIASGIRTKEEADNELVSIESYKVTDDTGKEKSVVRFSSSGESWFELNTIKKYGGDILPKSVSVNLYDLFTTIDNCREQAISFWIDFEVNELVVTSFYAPNFDADELEVRLPINSMWDGVINKNKPDINPLFNVKISPTVAFSLLKELNMQNKTEYINVVFNNGKVSFVVEQNGVMCRMRMKEHDVLYFYGAYDVQIPFSLFYLMASTGNIQGIDLSVYPQGLLWVTSEGYSFRYFMHDVPRVDTSLLDVTRKPIFVIEPEMAMSVIEKINKINNFNNTNEITYEYVDKGIADFYANTNGRMKVYSRAMLATLDETPIKFDGYLFKDMFTNTGVDAISVDLGENGNIMISYETSIMYKDVSYNHIKFMETIQDHQ